MGTEGWPGQPARPHDLPAQPTRLIGREAELAAARALLLDDGVRLLTLTGPAGAGKTRLALETAAALRDAFADGVWLVDLAPIHDPGLVASTIGQALGLRDAGGRPIAEALTDFLTPRQLLLVLDNFEQIVAAAPLVAGLLTACHRLAVLVTSRAALRLRWEHELTVGPLGVPDLARRPPVGELAAMPSVALFIERARAVRPDFRLTDWNAPAVAEICVRLDGLPLAIELAAARVKVLSPEAMLARLGNRLALLAGGAQDQPTRHHSLRAAVEWSHALLGPAERVVFRRLGVFVGGCAIEAAEAVCPLPLTAPDAGTRGTRRVGRRPGDAETAHRPGQHSPRPRISPSPRLGEVGREEVLDLLSSLVDKSLLRAEGSGGWPRFRMLETIREYAGERLAEAGEEHAARDRHAAHFLALAERAEADAAGPARPASFAALELEHDNLRAALRWLRERGRTESALRLAGALWPFWWASGYYTEGRAEIETLLARPEAVPPTAGRAIALGRAGELARVQGDHARARACHEEALAIWRSRGDEEGVASALRELGRVALDQGEFGPARSCLEESLTIRRRLGNRPGVAATLRWLGWLALLRGDPAQAEVRLTEALDIDREVGDQEGVVVSLQALARAAVDLAKHERARELCAESLRIGIEVGPRSSVAWCLEGFAQLAAARGQRRRMLRLMGSAAALREALNAPVGPAFRREWRRWLEPAGRSLSEAARAAADAAGRAMPLERAVEYALGPDDREDEGRSADDPLTPREREVAALLAEGLTNREVADRLVIGQRTVETHVERILRKLELSSRAQVAVWAAERLRR